LEAKALRHAANFSVLLVVGARQTGKSTLLGHLFGARAARHTFDPLIDIGNARRDPDFFLDQHPPALILDEIQYAPELISAIKRRVDRDRTPGQYFLTGSQNPSLLKSVSESLAGRVMILDMHPMTLVEVKGLAEPERPCWLEVLLNAGLEIPELAAFDRLPREPGTDTLFRRVWRGGYPRLLGFQDADVNDIFASYFQTYVERDIRILLEVRDEQQFGRFVALCATLTAQEINHAQLGREVGVTPQTADRWLAALRATYQWIEVPGYHGNTVKRVVGRGKGYFTDSGLAAWFQRISSPDALSGNPALGALFETYVAMNLVARLRSLTSLSPNLYHWRTRAGAEVDLLLERDGCFWPMEIKSAARVTSADTRGIRAFRETYPHLRHAPGIVVAAVEHPQRLPDNCLVLPYDLH
jgi:predicted AAA+ superfamily ATPase